MTDGLVVSNTTTSPWMSDMYLPRESSLLTTESLAAADLLFDQLDNGPDRLESGGVGFFPLSSIKSDWEGAVWEGLSLGSLSEGVECLGGSDVSVACSECSDETSIVEVDADLEETVDLVGFLDDVSMTTAATVMSGVSMATNGVLLTDKDDEEDLQSVCVSPSQWQIRSAGASEEEEEEETQDEACEESDTSAERKKCLGKASPSLRAMWSSLHDLLADSLQWETVPALDKQKVTLRLTEFVQAVDVRERVEILQILCPDLEGEALHGHVVIETQWITSDKLTSLFQLLKNNQRISSSCSCDHDNHSPRSPKFHPRSCHDSKSKSGCGCCHANSKHPEGAMSAKNRLKAHRRQSAHLTAKQRRVQQRKRNRQELKERKSGLFVQEQVLAVSTCDVECESDSDLDILT